MKKYLPHLYAILFFLAVVVFVFQPVFSDKELKQTDINNWKGMSKEITDFHDKTGEQTYWTNSMFGGMPAYQISAVYHANLIQYLNKLLMLGLPSPANLVFLYLLGFYFLLVTLRVDTKLAVLGAVAFAFSSYFFIIIEAGHNSKAHAIGYMAPVVAGVLMTFRGRLWLGSIITGLAVALELYANHLQITYYLLLILVVLGLVEGVQAVRSKQLAYYGKALGMMVLMALLAIGTNITNLWATQEYSKYSTRGPSELTSEKENKTTGLDRDYITDWSYGVGESFTLLVPGFKGGASEAISKNHRDALKSVSADYRENVGGFSAYFGDQPFTSGPVYIGAIVVLLFVIGLFIVEGAVKWWLLGVTVLSLLLSWGRNFMGFTNFFLDNVPGYDKFRAVAMILVIAEFAVPLLAVLTLQRLMSADLGKEMKKKVYIGMGIVVGLTLLITVSPGLFTDFYTQTEYDQVVESVKGQKIGQDVIDSFFQAVSTARMQIVKEDAMRSLLFVVVACAFIIAYMRFRFSSAYLVFGLLLFVLIDLGGVNARYLGADDYVRKSADSDPFPATVADQALEQDTSTYRVLNLSLSTFNDASTSYRHQSIGGYHGAKMKRYQELIENAIAPEMSMMRSAMQRQDSTSMQVITSQPVLNMLNAKYIIYSPDAPPLPNVGALGNVWMVPNYRIVPNSDSEIVAVAQFDPMQEMIVDQRYGEQLKGYTFQPDSTSNIILTSYQPNHLTYAFKSSAERLAVFSEIFYDKGWNAYIDGKPASHFRTNYVLRGMRIPPGNHAIEFKFEPGVIASGERISLATSALLLLLAVGIAVREFRKKA